MFLLHLLHCCLMQLELQMTLNTYWFDSDPQQARFAPSLHLRTKSYAATKAPSLYILKSHQDSSRCVGPSHSVYISRSESMLYKSMH